MSFFDDSSLAFLPSGAAGKDGKAYSIKPTDGTGDFTFSRGSNLAATRVGPTGLIEKGRENLLLQSNSFDTTWTPFNASVTSGQSGYDGSNDAWLLNITTSQNSSLYSSISMSGVYTTSVYAKANSVDYLGLRDYSLSGAGNWFNLSNGTIASTTSDCIDAKIESVGNGWYRCSITQNRNATGYTQIGASDNPSTTSTTSGSIYIQDAQLELGLAATDYIESGATTGKAGLLEDEPRFDYSGGATCPSLLLEPSRTNLVTYSEYFGAFANQESTDEQNTSDTTSPEGLNNACKVISSTNSQSYIYKVETTTAGDFTISAFLKKGDLDYALLLGFSGTNVYRAWFNISTGAVGTTSSSGILSIIDSDIEDYGNGWYRIWVSVSGWTGGLISHRIYPMVSGDDILTSPNTSFGYVYGAQLEAGSYPTSYIPNHSGGTITRGEDVPSLTGATSLIGQTEGTLFLETNFKNTSGFQVLLSAHGGASNKRFEIWSENNVVNGFIGGSVNIAIGNTTISNGVHKIAIAYKESGDQAFYVDGVQIGTSTTAFTISALTSLSFSTYLGALIPTEGVKQVLLFKERLSNTDLATLTTL